MELREILKGIDCKTEGIKSRLDISGVTSSSRDAREGSLFVAVKGPNADGHDFIDEAILKGAAVVLCEKDTSLHNGAIRIFVRDSKEALFKAASNFYNNPQARLKLIGVTGTNGKTTITFLIKSILMEAGINCGIIGTIGYDLGGRNIASKNTTPGIVELQRFLSEMVENSITHVAMEVSSHSLHQDRVHGLGFSVGCFTNLTQDHLDYHKDMEDYFKAKLRLFEGLGGGSFCVTNIDDDYGRRISSATRSRVVSYSTTDKGASIFAHSIKMDAGGAAFRVESSCGRFDVKTPLVGRHNIYNILAAIGIAASCGIKVESMIRAIEKFKGAPGRLEAIESSRLFKVFVDYAHTDDALKNVLLALRGIAKSRIILVFGCGGDRDKLKRPKMGRVASELSDYCIITSDNPRSEEPLAIIDDIKNGISSDNYEVHADRREAIRRALEIAKKDDIVLLAGKGHEAYQSYKDRTIPFDDRAVARELLNG